MTILVTGAAGFIGSAVSVRLLELGFSVVGLDDHNDYYSPKLKEDRIQRQLDSVAYSHYRGNIADREFVTRVFDLHDFTGVVHLAAQAGVRYSISNPGAYIESNLLGFFNIIDCAAVRHVSHFVYASSSSVYGANRQMPFSTHAGADHPLNLYAATKKSNELIAHSYSHLHRMPTTGLRFFTVYGPWGRPDMAPYKFAAAMLKGETIDVYNFGNHRRDFTFIDDIVEGVVRVLKKPAEPHSGWLAQDPDPASSSAPWRVYNIGAHQPVQLMDFIDELEAALGVSASKQLLPLQPGDLPDTLADVNDLVSDLGYRPSTSVGEGVSLFANWFLEYTSGSQSWS